MESGGLFGKVNVSSMTRELLESDEPVDPKNEIICRFEHNKAIEVPNLGNSVNIESYFIEIEEHGERNLNR